jgi:hypothetical protein
MNARGYVIIIVREKESIFIKYLSFLYFMFAFDNITRKERIL